MASRKDEIWHLFSLPSITKLDIKLIESIEGKYKSISCTDWDIEHMTLDTNGHDAWLSLEYEPMHVECDDETKSVTIEWRI